MTEKTLAEKLKLTRQTLNYYRKIGCPYSLSPKGQLNYDLKAVVEWRKHALVPRSRGRGLPEYEKARATRMHFAAERARLDYEKRLSELVELRAVKQAESRCHAHVRTMLQQLTDRLAAVFAAERDPLKIHAMMTQEYRQLLEGLEAALLPASPTE